MKKTKLFDVRELVDTLITEYGEEVVFSILEKFDTAAFGQEKKYIKDLVVVNEDSIEYLE